VTGGRLKLGVSGGGPCDRDVQEFVSAAIVPLLQGYGLTETCGGGTVQIPGDTAVLTVGMPLGSVSIRFRVWGLCFGVWDMASVMIGELTV
jgi:long-chain acyl-CoA synthetase